MNRALYTSALEERREEENMSITYNPSNKFEIESWEVEFRRAPKRVLMARIYQPQGAGPFPVLLDLHGGAWNNKDHI